MKIDFVVVVVLVLAKGGDPLLLLQRIEMGDDRPMVRRGRMIDGQGQVHVQTDRRRFRLGGGIEVEGFLFWGRRSFPLFELSEVDLIGGDGEDSTRFDPREVEEEDEEKEDEGREREDPEQKTEENRKRKRRIDQFHSPIQSLVPIN